MSNKTPTEQRLYQLKLYQSHPLNVKIAMTKRKICEWHRHYGGKVYVAFSGGKDSTVLLDLVWSIYPDVPAVFADTGNELESVKEFVRGYGERITWVEPEKTLEDVIDKYGYPVISKKTCMGVNRFKNTKSMRQKILRAFGGINPTSGKKQEPTVAKKWHKLFRAPFNVTSKCCGELKIKPFLVYQKCTGYMPFVGTMAADSKVREDSYIRHGGCNAFDQGDPQSRPMAFWLEQDVLRYIKDNQLPIAGAYGELSETTCGKLCTTGDSRTGCKFCLFGIHMEKGENRIQRLARVEPEAYRHCIEDLRYDIVMDYLGIDWRPVQDLFLK